MEIMHLHFKTERLLSLPHGMFKDSIDLSILKDAQPGFSSQIVCNSLPQKVKHPNVVHKYLFSRFQAEIFIRNNVTECIQN